jgi:hypothetical protein
MFSEEKKEMDKSLDWYYNLDMNQKINLKSLSETICGIPFWFMVSMFGFKESIYHIHTKLKMEGFDV